MHHFSELRSVLDALFVFRFRLLDKISSTALAAMILDQKVKIKVLPAPLAHRAAPIPVSVARGHTSANAVKATAGGWSTGNCVCLTFPLHSLCRAPDEKAVSTILKVFGMTRPGLEPTTYWL